MKYSRSSSDDYSKRYRKFRAVFGELLDESAVLNPGKSMGFVSWTSQKGYRLFNETRTSLNLCESA